MNKKLIIIISSSLLVLAMAGFSYVMISKDAMLIRNPVIVQQNAMITYYYGECQFRESDDLEWQPLEIGQKIKIGFSLETGNNGEIDIRFSDNTLMKMDNNTILKISENTLKNLSVDLMEGKLFAKFHKLFKDQEFSVFSGNAVAGVRGTDLVFEAFPERTDIYALSGITEIYNYKMENSKILLAFQKKTTIKNNSAPTRPVDMDREEILEFQQILNLIHGEKVFLITDNIHFVANKAEILPSSNEELISVLEAMKSNSYDFEITGHTADVGSSSAKYNLSLQRAQAIKDYLVNNGIREKRLMIKGYGSSKPVSGNDTPEEREKNRRVEFIIIED